MSDKQELDKIIASLPETERVKVETIYRALKAVVDCEILGPLALAKLGMEYSQ